LFVARCATTSIRPPVPDSPGGEAYDDQRTIISGLAMKLGSSLASLVSTG